MKTVVLVSAKLQSGKNQLVSYMEEFLHEELVISTGTASYAGPLKARAWEDFQPLFDLLETKHAELLAAGAPAKDIAWMVAKENNMYEDKTELTRVLLQMYGTEIFRRRVSSNYWVDLCVQTVAASPAEFVFISDVRFPNEVEAFYTWAESDPDNRKVVTIRVERPDHLRKASQATSDGSHEHPSETGLDDYPIWDYVVDNSGTLEDLRGGAQAICRAILNENNEK